MNYYNRYKKQIETRIAEGSLTEEYIAETTERLEYYLGKKKITQAQYDELIAILYVNDKKQEKVL